MQKRFYTGMFLIVLLVSLSAAFLFTNARPAFRGQALSSPRPAAEIDLADAHGAAFRMSAQRGNVVLLYFGFVNCPEECPLTMAHFKQALETLGPEAASHVRVVMVSTDPVRDTPATMSAYLEKFNPAFIGVPGSPEELARIWHDYDVQVLDGGETHSSYTYVIDRNGRLRLNFVPETSPEDIVHDLKILLSEN